MKKIKNLVQNITQPVKLFFLKLFRASIAVDYLTLANFKINGKKLEPIDLINLYHKTNVLFYKSTTFKGVQPPIVLNRGLLSLKPVFIDWNKLSEEEKKKIMDKIEKS